MLPLSLNITLLINLVVLFYEIPSHLCLALTIFLPKYPYLFHPLSFVKTVEEVGVASHNASYLGAKSDLVVSIILKGYFERKKIVNQTQLTKLTIFLNSCLFFLPLFGVADVIFCSILFLHPYLHRIWFVRIIAVNIGVANIGLLDCVLIFLF